jgi:ParB family transcriptional regulator, chromosome partitioning protein
MGRHETPWDTRRVFAQVLSLFAAQRHDARMRTPCKNTGHLQLDLLGLEVLSDAVVTPTSCAAGQPLMLPVSSLFADPQNPRTEVPGAELNELAEDIRQHGILQPIVVHPADADGRHQIHFGVKRWRAAQRIGLQEVPVVVRDAPSDGYAQVAENQKRHGLTPLDLARFIRSKVAHHLALLALPPALDAAMKAGRCSSPRTLYELSKLHAAQPGRIADLVASNEPITREAVAQIRDATLALCAAPRITTLAPPRPNGPAQLLACANTLCERLDAALLRLSQTDTTRIADDVMNALRQQILTLASRLDR